VAALSIAQGASAAGTSTSPPAPAQNVVVIVKSGISVVQDAKNDGATPQNSFLGAVDGYSASLNAAQLARVKSDPNVVMVAPDQELSLTGPPSVRGLLGRGPGGNGQPSAGKPITSYRQFIPTDLERVGLQNSRLADVNGRGPNVDAGIAIVDGGVNPNPDLNVAGSVNCSDDPSGDVGDGSGHGTGVASVAAAIDNGFGIVGAAPGATVYNVKVFDDKGHAKRSNVICGLDWVIAHHNVIDVANMSFEFNRANDANDGDCGLKNHDAFHYAICRAQAAGVTLVAGAGNDAGNTKVDAPQSYPEVITVAGYQDTDGKPGGHGKVCGDGFHDADDMFATFSNFGPSVDLMAVADCNQVISNDGTLEWDSGTSFAGPAVAGAAADLIARDRQLTPFRVEQDLEATATHRHLGPDPYGYGLLDMSAL
jgi:hypothetical protein